MNDQMLHVAVIAVCAPWLLGCLWLLIRMMKDGPTMGTPDLSTRPLRTLDDADDFLPPVNVNVPMPPVDSPFIVPLNQPRTDRSTPGEIQPREPWPRR